MKCKCCKKEIEEIRRSGYCETCYRLYELAYQTGYNACRFPKAKEKKD